jgi:hypothetical protein
VWMIETRSHPDLTKKSFRANLGRYLRPQDLDRDGTLVAEVASKKYNGHSPFAEWSLDEVSASEAGFEALLKLTHRYIPFRMCWKRSRSI